MPKLIFFHDVLADGGIVTDLDRGDARLYHRFEKGRGEKDSTVRWGVSLWCEGEGVPDDPAEVRGWLLRHEAVVRAGLLACASELDTRPDDPDPTMWVRFAWYPLSRTSARGQHDPLRLEEPGTLHPPTRESPPRGGRALEAAP